MDDLNFPLDFLWHYNPLNNWKSLLTLVVVVILAAMVIVNKSKWTRREKWFRTALWFYIYLIFSYTVLCRSGNDYFDYKLIPLWSYRKIWMTHSVGLALQVFMNCLMFIPVGLLTPFAYENYLGRDEVRTRKMVIIIGFAVSAAVEFLQLVTQTGLFEWDDILHNTIGAITGYGIYLIIRHEPFRKARWYFLPFGLVMLGLLAAMLS
ncbi:VanZ family protein [Acetobacterium bakii]|uniref:VanZ-like domain-containing protein n=1 Tax=Acetobacterium bakii TaxID=52689 RepID=A0A0L6TXM5_9FIRM|nr:VanZ family protein [Acetobacterium bakii]KNZ40320.1 hypothetical protein AKG39_18170 [Acetobacterium bakii]